MTHKITRFLTLFLLVSLGGCTVQSEHHIPENAAFCDDLTKHVQQVQQLHVASGTTPCPTKTPDTAAVCNYQTTYGMWFPYGLRRHSCGKNGRTISGEYASAIPAGGRYGHQHGMPASPCLR